ncbi:MAG: ATP-binding protein [Actinomycetota bacterium]
MTPQAYRLKPWREMLRPHEDILGGRLDMSTYAADLGAVDRGDPNTPRVYRDPLEFFRTTYPTVKLRELLTDVLTVLGGGGGDRVIQLRTPFGGGKTHSLLALYHLLKARESIDPADLAGIPDPGAGRVAVLSCLDLDPWAPREVDGLAIRTLWGELAFRLGGQPGYDKVRVHDEEGSPPGNDVLRPLLAGGPVLILLDEVLVYVQRAGGREGDHPFRKQVMNFLQGMTELVRGLPNAAMVYSLQASEHEAAGDQALLSDLDHLVTRVDAKREPVSDEEVMRVVRRRLFPEFGSVPEHEAVAREVAREYAVAYRRLREAYAETTADRRAAAVEAERFEQRVVDAYPFHPELLDLMYHRWGSLPSYQRTRGALQFLARVVHGLWNGARPPQALIGPGDVPLEDEHVRGAFLSQVGERERYSSVLAADITGDGARAKEVDRRIAADSPVFDQLRVGTRVATGVMLYSFGARQGEDRGAVEGDLVEALVTPDLDRNVVTTALHDLREELLYMHHVGRRYRFEPKANLNLLIAEERKKFDQEEVLGHIREALGQALGDARDEAVLWPADSRAIPDGLPMFRVVYLGEEWAGAEEPPEISRVESLVERHGSGPREYQNSLAFAVPGAEAFDRARRAARTAMAIGSILGQSRQHDLGTDQVEELRERQRAARAELSGALDRLYETILVPVAEREGDRPFRLDPIDLRAQLAAGRSLHERILDGLRKQVFDSLTPARIATLARLGEERSFVSCAELGKWFFSYFDFPKLRSDEAIKDAIGRGTAGTFGYVSGAEVEDGTVRPRRRSSVWFGEPLDASEIDLGPDAFVLSAELAQELRGETGDQPPTAASAEDAETTVEGPSGGPEGGGEVAAASRLRLRAAANAAQFFRILPALQNLADRSSRFVARFEIEAEAEDTFDPRWLRNAVEEHLEEAGVEAETDLE